MRPNAVVCGILVGFALLNPSGAQTPESAGNASLLSKENVVDAASGGGSWAPATVGQALAVNDRLRTGEDSRAAVRLTDLSVLRMDELTTITIGPPTAAGDKPSLNVKEGTTYFFSREKSREIRVETPAANGAIRGTEFVVTVAANGSTTMTMLDGEVELSNAQGSLVVTAGEQAKVDVGGAPRKTAVLEAINSVQWCLYYPGVLDLKELGFSRNSRMHRSPPTTRAICWRPWPPTDIAPNPARMQIRSITPVCCWRLVRWTRRSDCSTLPAAEPRDGKLC